jgi:HAD superfamily hydrolase (TIGR01458 family)
MKDVVMQSVRALLLDLSGVLYVGDARVEGAVETVRQARDRGWTLRFVTNTATRNRAQILDKLHTMDIPLEDDELFTAPMAALACIRRENLTPYALVHENLQEDFAEVSGENPDCVVLGDARDGLTYSAMNRAFRLVREGAPLLAIGYNKYFKAEEGMMLDAGAFVHALEWAAGVEARVLGKPSADFFHEVVGSTGAEASECLMIGDDADADVAAAVRAGLQGCLVRTGKYNQGDEDRLPNEAWTIGSIADLFSAAG